MVYLMVWETKNNKEYNLNLIQVQINLQIYILYASLQNYQN